MTDFSREGDSDLSYVERVEKYRSQVIDPLQDTYEALLGDACGARIAAAVCRYIAGRFSNQSAYKTQRHIAEQYGVSEATIRKRWKEIREGAIADLKAADAFEDYGVVNGSKKNERTDETDESEDDDSDTEPSGSNTRVFERKAPEREIVISGRELDEDEGETSGPIQSKDDATGIELVERLAELRGWDEYAPGYGSNRDLSGEYSVSRYRSGSSWNIVASGFSELTGTDEEIEWGRRLVEQWGLDPDEDFSLSISLNNGAVWKLLCAHEEFEGDCSDVDVSPHSEEEAEIRQRIESLRQKIQREVNRTGGGR